MPVVHAYRDSDGFYIKSNLGGALLTHQVDAAGRLWLRRHGLGDESYLSPTQFQRLLRQAHLWTGGSGSSDGGGEWGATLRTRRRASHGSSLARDSFRSAFPLTSRRRAVGRLLSGTIRLVDAVSASVWAVTLTDASRWFLRLNVGRMEAIALHEDGTVLLLVQKSRLAWFDVNDWRDRKVAALKPAGYKGHPRLAFLSFEAARLREVLPRARDAHQHACLAAAYAVEDSPYRATHSPVVLEYLRRLGCRLP